MKQTDKQMREQLERVVRELRPGTTYEIKRSDGKLFGTIGVPSGAEPDDELRTELGGDHSKKTSWFD